MAETKTKSTDASVAEHLASRATPEQLADCKELMAICKRVTKQAPKMWGPSIVGFGSYHYKYATGREADMPMAGFSPRAGAMTLYVMRGSARYDELVSRLGKCKTSVACVYINKLADVDLKVLRELMTSSYQHLKAHGLHADLTQRSSKPRKRAATVRSRA